MGASRMPARRRSAVIDFGRRFAYPRPQQAAADFLGDGVADADHGVAIISRVHQKDKAGRRRAPSGIRGKEIGALAYRD